uniref:Annexin n=1 Tax=Rhizophora mucronata TaxID=61149 RepID=A0A2P2IZE6_RHIMU
MATLTLPGVVTSPTQDSEGLRQAVKGNRTNKEAIIWILGHRNAGQKRKIRDTYQQLYDESLIDRLHSKLSGDFGMLAVFVNTCVSVCNCICPVYAAFQQGCT